MSVPAHTPAFAGAALDRASAQRTDPDWVAERWSEPGARAVGFGRDAILMAGEDAAGVARVEPGPLAELASGPPVLLGLEDGHALFALDLSDAPADRIEAAAAGSRLLSVREAGGLLSQSEGGLAAYAAAVLNWHRSHSHCASCGAESEVEEAGHVRRCPRCGAVHHPRTDPVVIMLVTDGERLMLGRQAAWPVGWHSALAGFVEPGESLEEAVVREVREESGVEVREPRYVSSQPWPFPGSLMLGFVAQHASGEPAVGDGELEAVGWFTRTALAAAVRGEGELRVPPPVAIARRLINGWLEAGA